LRDGRGAASVEHVGLSMLVALLLLAAVAAVAGEPPLNEGRTLGATIGRRIACGPLLPKPCRRHPLALAYGFPLGKLVRALAPRVTARAGPGGAPLVPVDFRYCRRASCAVPAVCSDSRLTSANRRTTAFTAVEDRRRAGSGVRITYWLYRPGLGWESVVRSAGRAELAAAGALRLNDRHDPRLVPLETLAGRNHYRFEAAERPPWRWRVASRYPD
jgi:hypothetical protein